MELLTDEKQKQEQEWLEQLQRNSWEPEVIISGIILAFIFAFPAQVYEFAIRIIQDYGLKYLGAWLVLIYISQVINLFKIFFILHLSLRFAWAGLLGLSYAFPRGVINENLFKNARHYTYSRPSDMVLKLERICSMTFAFPLMLRIVFIIISCYLSLLLLIHKVFNLNFFVIYLIFLVSVMAFSALALINKKSKLRAKFARTIFSSVQAIYQSNLGKWSIISYTFFIIFLTFPFVRIDIQDFSLYFHETNLSEDQLEWPNKAWYFDSYKEADKRFPRVLLPAEEISGKFTVVSLAHFVEDQEFVQALNTYHQYNLDTLGWKKIQLPTDLYRFYVNDSLISLSGWKKTRMAASNQRVYQSILDLSTLPAGAHEVRVEKVLARQSMLNLTTEVRLRKNWAKFSFIKR